jgi:hypothetical protein
MNQPANPNLTSAEYPVSIREVNRRKGAFSSFLLCFLVGMIVTSLYFLVSNIPWSLILVVVFALLLFGLSYWNIRWQNRFSRKRITAGIQGIKRSAPDSEETYLYKDVRRITTKRTVKGYIRQIKLTLDSGRSTTINGLNPQDSENLNEAIKHHCSDTAKYTEMKEPLDFDHPLFYPVLGLVLSSLFTLAIRLMAGLNESNLKILDICIIAFVALVGLAIFLMRPFYNLHGNKGRKNDIILGTSFLVVAAVLAFYLFFQ